eukprot:scaffold15475_cov34-Prasinocladus_malaysianus.AAC.1
MVVFAADIKSGLLGPSGARHGVRGYKGGPAGLHARLAVVCRVVWPHGRLSVCAVLRAAGEGPQLGPRGQLGDLRVALDSPPGRGGCQDRQALKLRQRLER